MPVNIVRPFKSLAMEAGTNLVGLTGTRRPVGPARVVTFHVPAYPPVGKNGSERSAEATARMLAEDGMDVRVVAKHGPGRGRYDGVSTFEESSEGMRRAYAGTDFVLTQLESRPIAAFQARLRRVPYGLFIRLGLHNGMVWRGKPDVYVFNSKWLRDSSGVAAARSIVLHPPIDPGRYRTDDGEREFISLINLTTAKGGHLFWELASRMPERRFLGVAGYGQQILPESPPRNVVVWDRQEDIREVYRRSRIVLVPSLSETFGRVALEAAASAIPVIAHPSNGLLEVLGQNGMFCDRDDPQAWVSIIRQLDDPERYEAERTRSHAVLARFDFDREARDFVACVRSAGTSPTP